MDKSTIKLWDVPPAPVNPTGSFSGQKGQSDLRCAHSTLGTTKRGVASGDDTKKSCCVLSFQNCGYHLLSHVITCHHRLMIGPWEIWSSYIFRTWLAEHQMKMMIGMINILETKIGDVFQPAAWHLSGIVSGQHWNLRKGQWAHPPTEFDPWWLQLVPCLGVLVEQQAKYCREKCQHRRLVVELSGGEMDSWGKDRPLLDPPGGSTWIDPVDPGWDPGTMWDT